VPPRDVDLVIPAGQSATIHDPIGQPIVQLDFTARCEALADVEIASATTRGRDGVRVTLRTGDWPYVVRCKGQVLAEGRITVLRDKGQVQMSPDLPMTRTIRADGRAYRISYPTEIPWISVIVPTKRLILIDGTRQYPLDATTGAATIPPALLHEGTFGLSTARGITLLVLTFDPTGPVIFISAPDDGAAWGSQIGVAVSALPGWTVSIDRTVLGTGVLEATVPAPATRALVITAVHPQLGTHHFLRRSRR
jgi:hypothetical protein